MKTNTNYTTAIANNVHIRLLFGLNSLYYYYYYYYYQKY